MWPALPGQLQCALNRIYALDRPRQLKRAALILSSGDADVYEGAEYEYRRSFLEYLGLEDMGVYTFCEWKDAADRKREELYRFGRSLPLET